MVRSVSLTFVLVFLFMFEASETAWWCQLQDLPRIGFALIFFTEVFITLLIFGFFSPDQLHARCVEWLVSVTLFTLKRNASAVYRALEAIHPTPRRPAFWPGFR